MTTATQPTPTINAPSASALQQFTDVWTRENATTRRVITALPEGQSEFRPHERSQSAREVAYIFSISQSRIAQALTNQWQWPPQRVPVPATYAEVIAAFDASTQAVKDALSRAAESRLAETVPFFTAPRQMGEVPVGQLIWFMLLDAVHHRGQFSVYLRMTGGKVPSIYGPSADEPWN
jgi:uncharacterized damage-inducible protein DinB